MAARAHPCAGLAASHREVPGPWFVENCFGSLESRNVPPEGLIGFHPQAAAV